MFRSNLIPFMNRKVLEQKPVQHFFTGRCTHIFGIKAESSVAEEIAHASHHPTETRGANSP